MSELCNPYVPRFSCLKKDNTDNVDFVKLRVTRSVVDKGLILIIIYFVYSIRQDAHEGKLIRLGVP